MSVRKATLRPGDHIIDLGLSPRAYNALINNGIVTVGRLTQCTATDLAKMKNLGATSLANIYRMMEHAGLELATDPNVPDAPAPGTSIAELKVACQSAYTQFLTAQIRLRRAEAALEQALTDELETAPDSRSDLPAAVDATGTTDSTGETRD